MGASAQDNLLGELYGVGVHAYFAGSYGEAEESLSAAVAGGSRDPRVYYFRGLARSGSGDSEAARADYKKGGRIGSERCRR